MRILCIVYGIGRGVRISSQSINNNLLNPIRKLNAELEVLYILNEVKFVENPRSKDNGKVPPVPSQVFGEEELVRMSKAQLLNKSIFNCVKGFKDVHDDNFRTYENLLCQLGMLSEANRRRDFSLYDRVLMIRDDLSIEVKNIEIARMLYASQFGPVTSMWHWHGGVAERFLLSKPDIASRLADRLQMVESFVRTKGYLNGEHLQDYALGKDRNTVLAFDLRLTRIRLDGIVDENFLFPIWRPLEFPRVLLAVFKYYFRIFSKRRLKRK
jgi:hypothetical protein